MDMLQKFHLIQYSISVSPNTQPSLGYYEYYVEITKAILLQSKASVINLSSQLNQGTRSLSPAV